MFEFLKHITPRIKILSLSLILILLPGASISYLSLKSIQEKADNQRVKYHGTANLVRDKLESELYQIETNFRNTIIDSLLKLESVADHQLLLQRINMEYPSIKNLTLLGNKGELITGFASSGLNKPPGSKSNLSSEMSSIISRAEKEEFINKNYPGAIGIYRKALSVATSLQEKAILHARIGRSYFKLQSYDKGILEYGKILEYGEESLSIGNIPATVVALYQKAEGYKELNESQDRKKILMELYQRLLYHPWDLQGGEYLFYLNSTIGAIREIEPSSTISSSEMAQMEKLKNLDEKIVTQSELILFLEDRIIEEVISGLNHLASSEIKHRTFTEQLIPTIELGYFLLPTTTQQPLFRALVFQFDEGYLLTQLFPQVLSTVELGKDIVPGILNENDSLLYFHNNHQVSGYLVAENFSQYFSRWKVALFERSGKSIEQLTGRERHLYLGLFIGILAVMLLGIVILARVMIHESEVSRMKSEFVSNVTHELKTPLALIRMFGETLDSGIVTEEKKRKEFYSIIRKESERLTHLINNVLDFSKIDTGKKDYNFEEADLVSTIRQSLEAYRFHIRDSGFEFDYKMPEEPVMASIDKDAISQAFLNLLSNAVKYSEERKYIYVEVRKESQSVIVSVKDHGAGIAKEELKKIFDKFYRVPNPMKKQPRGSGLGLTLTKHIVEAHKGKIEVESEPGKGSRFTIRLPLL
ncbi:MAG: hypothetical protein DRI97_06620 [Bacteroidetes bacterium]|nr:MAG: hypothetical protein DRI97_06620 [Bacteroidota bacterium]